MVVGYRSSSRTGQSDSFVTSINVPVPAGAAAGDIALLALEQWEAANPVVTWPSGFTQILSVALGSQKLRVAWKRLTGSDTGNYTCSWSGSQWTIGECVLITGAVATGDPVGANYQTQTASSGTSTPTTSLTIVDAAFLAHFVANENSASKTAPTSFAEVQDSDYLATNYRTPGASGTYSAAGGTTSASTAQIAALIAVAPDAGGGFDGAVSGTVSASSAASGAPLATRLPVGTASATSMATGVVGALRPVSGTTAASSAASGSPLALQAAAGMVPVSSAVSGAVTIAGSLDASGAVSAVSAASGSVSVLRPVGGSVTAMSTVSGTAQAARPIAGTVAAQSAAVGTADVAGSLSVSGTVVAQSTTTGAPLARYVISGTVDVISVTSGAPLARLSAAGAVQALSTTSGVVGRILETCQGVVSAVSGATGSPVVGVPAPTSSSRVWSGIPRVLVKVAKGRVVDTVKGGSVS